MKKFMVFALALALCLAIAAPAMAKYTVGAKILTTVGWATQSEERTTSGESITSFWAAVEGHSRLFVSFVNAAKDTGAFVELGLSSYTSASVSLRHAYGWYKVGNCKFLAGHTDNWFGSLAFAPSQNVSLTPHLKLLFMDWGTQWGKRRPQLSFTYMAGGFGFQIGIAQPLATSVTGWTGGDLYYTIPEIWAAIQFRAGGFATIPSFSWTRYQYEGTTGGIDDSVDAWAFIFPMKFNVGPISIRFAAHYIVNQGLTPLWNAAGDASTPVLNGTSFEDTVQTGGNLALHYYAGAFSIYAGVGMEKIENDTWAKKDYTRIAYFIACRYKVTKNFFINPEFGYYDYGDNYTTGADNGNEWILGALFAFAF